MFHMNFIKIFFYFFEVSRKTKTEEKGNRVPRIDLSLN